MIVQVVLLPFFIGFLLTFRQAESRGVLYIKLNEFYNPLGRTYQGYCCDIGYVDADGVCIDQCDYVMRLIVSGLGRANDHVFLFHRPLKYDSNNVVFKQNDSSLVLTVLFDKWPHTGRVQMNAFFYDYDDYDHTTTLVDWFETDLLPREESIQRDTGRHARGSFKSQAVTGNRKDDQTELSFQWSALCDEGSECFQSASLADDLSLYNNFPFFEEFGEMNGFESAYEYKVPRVRRKSAKKLSRYQQKKREVKLDDDTRDSDDLKVVKPKYQYKEPGSKSLGPKTKKSRRAEKGIPEGQLKRRGRIENGSQHPTRRQEEIKPVQEDGITHTVQRKNLKYPTAVLRGNQHHSEGNTRSYDHTPSIREKKIRRLPYNYASKRQSHAYDFDNIINEYENSGFSENQHNMALKNIAKNRVSDVIAVYREDTLAPFAETNVNDPETFERADNLLYTDYENHLEEKENILNSKDNLLLKATDAPTIDGYEEGEKQILALGLPKSMRYNSPASKNADLPLSNRFVFGERQRTNHANTILVHGNSSHRHLTNSQTGFTPGNGALTDSRVVDKNEMYKDTFSSNDNNTRQGELRVPNHIKEKDLTGEISHRKARIRRIEAKSTTPLKIEPFYIRPSDHLSINENYQQEAANTQSHSDHNRKEDPNAKHLHKEHAPQELFPTQQTEGEYDYISPTLNALPANGNYDVPKQSSIVSGKKLRQTGEGSRITFFTLPLPFTEQQNFNNAHNKNTHNRDVTTFDSFHRRGEISDNGEDMGFARKRTRNIHSERFIANVISGKQETQNKGHVIHTQKNPFGVNEDSVKETGYIYENKRGGKQSNIRKSNKYSSPSPEKRWFGEDLNYRHEPENTMGSVTLFSRQHEYYGPLFGFEDDTISKPNKGYVSANTQVSEKIHHGTPSPNDSFQNYKKQAQSKSNHSTEIEKSEVDNHLAQRKLINSGLKHWVTTKSSSDQKEGHSKIEEYEVQKTKWDSQVLSKVGYSPKILQLGESIIHSSTENPFDMISYGKIGGLSTNAIHSEMMQQRKSETQPFLAETVGNQFTQYDYATTPSEVNRENPSLTKASGGPVTLEKPSNQNVEEIIRELMNDNRSEYVPHVLSKLDSNKHDFNQDRTTFDFVTGVPQTYKQIDLHLPPHDKKAKKKLPEKTSNTRRKVYSIDVTVKPVETSEGNIETAWLRDFHDKNAFNDNEVQSELSKRRRQHQNRFNILSNAELLYHSIEKLKSMKFLTAAPVHWYVTEHPAFRLRQRNHGHNLFNVHSQSPSWYDSDTKDNEFVQLNDIKVKQNLESHVKIKSSPDKKRGLSDQSNHRYRESQDKQNNTPAMAPISETVATIKSQDYEDQSPQRLGKKSFHIPENRVDATRAPYHDTLREHHREDPVGTKRHHRREETDISSQTTPLIIRHDTNDETGSESYKNLISSQQNRHAKPTTELIDSKQISEGNTLYKNSEDIGTADVQSSPTKQSRLRDTITKEWNPTTSQTHEIQTSKEWRDVSPNYYSTNTDRSTHSRWKLEKNKHQFYPTPINHIGKELDSSTAERKAYEPESKKYSSIWDNFMNLQVGEWNDHKKPMTGKIWVTATQTAQTDKSQQNLDQVVGKEEHQRNIYDTDKGIIDDQRHRNEEMLNEDLQWNFDNTRMSQYSESNSNYDETAEDTTLAYGPPIKPWKSFRDYNRERKVQSLQLNYDAPKTTEIERKSKSVTQITDTQRETNVKQNYRNVYRTSNKDEIGTSPDALYNTHQFPPQTGLTRVPIGSGEAYYESPDKIVFSGLAQKSPSKLKNSNQPQTVSDRSPYLDQVKNFPQKLNTLDQEQDLSDISTYLHQEHVLRNGGVYSEGVLEFPTTSMTLDQAQSFYESSPDPDPDQALHNARLSPGDIRERPDMLWYINPAKKLTSAPISPGESEKLTDTWLHEHQTNKLLEVDLNSEQSQKSTDSSVYSNQEHQSPSISSETPKAVYTFDTGIKNINRWVPKNSLEPITQTPPVYQVPVPFMSKSFNFLDKAFLSTKIHETIQHDMSKYPPSDTNSSTAITRSLALDMKFNITPLTKKDSYINNDGHPFRVTSKHQKISDGQIDNSLISTVSVQYKHEKGDDLSNKEDITKYQAEDGEKRNAMDKSLVIADQSSWITTETWDQPGISFTTQGGGWISNVTEQTNIIPTTRRNTHLFPRFTEKSDYSLALETADSSLSSTPYSDESNAERDSMAFSHNPLFETPRTGGTQSKLNHQRANQNTDISLENIDSYISKNVMDVLATLYGTDEKIGRKLDTQEDGDKDYFLSNEPRGINHKHMIETTKESNSKSDKVHEPSGSKMSTPPDLPTSQIRFDELGFTWNFRHNETETSKNDSSNDSRSERIMDYSIQSESQERKISRTSSGLSYSPGMDHTITSINTAKISEPRNEGNAPTTTEFEDSSLTQSTTPPFGDKSTEPLQFKDLNIPIEFIHMASARLYDDSPTPSPILESHTSDPLFDKLSRRDEMQISKSRPNSDILSLNETRNKDSISLEKVRNPYTSPRNDLSPTAHVRIETSSTNTQSMDSNKLATAIDAMISPSTIFSERSETQPMLVNASMPTREITKHAVIRTTRAIEYKSDGVSNESLQGNKIRGKKDSLTYSTKNPPLFGLLSDILESDTLRLKDTEKTTNIHVKTPSSTEDPTMRSVNIEDVSFAKQLGRNPNNHKEGNVHTKKDTGEDRKQSRKQNFKRPYIKVPYLGLKRPPPKPSSLMPFVPELNIPQEMKALPEMGFILQTLHPPLNIHKAVIHHANPNFTKLAKAKRPKMSRPRDINVDKFREFVYNIRHGPKLDIPLKSLYGNNETNNATNSTGRGEAQELPQLGRREGVPQVNLRSVKTVFTRYWPAVLGVTIGTIFLLAGLATSLWCKQHRLLIRRARWTDSPQHLSEPPDTSEYATSSAASLTSDLARSSVNLV